MKNLTLIFVSFWLLFACQQQPSSVDFNALTEEQQRLPENALASMTVSTGLQVELFASEPMISNPTNIDIDAKGRVWMIEGQNYRNQHNPDNPYRPTGDRILILEDTNGDGKADSKKVFYEGENINSALGIAVLGNKVYISHSPQILVFTDENGDDIPDKQEVLFSNMSGDQHDHGVHAITFGADGRLYFNMGNEGKQLTDQLGNPILDRLGRPINTNDGVYRQGLALRFEQDGSKLEVLGHNFRNPFELAADSYCTLWQSDNDDDGNRGTRINYVMQYGNYGFTDEMTGAGWRTRRIGMHDSIPLRHWHLNDPGVVPNLLQTGSGSPTGIVIYEGDLLPDIFHNQMIHCEPGHQVVRSYIAQADGAGYTAKIQNILQSKDKWFRPSDVGIAPDGSIFIADWYDPGVGGHKMGDPARGRIYRIAPNTKQHQVPTFDVSTPIDAVKALQSPNLATRFLAWTALHQAGKKAEKELLALYENGKPHLRARAFWLLARLSPDYIQTALQDKDTNLQLAAIRAAQYLDEPNLLKYLAQVVNHSNPAIRREVALALRYQDGDAAAQLWTTLATQYDGKDRWYLEALGIGADLHAEAYFKVWQKTVGDNWKTPANLNIVWRIRTPATIPLLSEALKSEQITEKEIARLFRALHFQPKVNKDPYLAPLLVGNHPQQQHLNAYTLGSLSPNYYQQSPLARATVEKILPTIAGTPAWLDAVKSMKLNTQAPQLLDMVLQSKDNALRREAVEVLITTTSPKTVTKLFNTLSPADKNTFLPFLGQVETDFSSSFLQDVMKETQLPLSVRQTAATSIANSWKGQFELAKLLDSGKIEPALQTAVALKLASCWDPSVKASGIKALQAAKGKDGNTLTVNELVNKTGNAGTGRYVFKTYCESCHQVHGEGVEFGPSLSEIGSKLAKRALYEAIFYPSAGINFGYEGYLIKTKDANVYSGYIISQTESELTLRTMGGLAQTIAQNQIVTKEAMEQSLMTANLQTAMTETELIDLVEYLSSLQQPL
ncbi:MAG: c-type cytochrome [Saprospiraceae bacterium]|nr:c-type cytochrome [Saprospiraceae bacterium]